MKEAKTNKKFSHLQECVWKLIKIVEVHWLVGAPYFYI